MSATALRIEPRGPSRTIRGLLGGLTALALLAVTPASAQETISARRLNDSVAVRDGASREERVLYYFDPSAELAEGDELEQGSGGQTTVVLSNGGVAELFSSCHLIVEDLGEGGDVLRFPILTHGEITSGLRELTLWLPGGTRCSFLGTTVTVRVEPGRMLVRNEGGPPVELEGTITLVTGSAEGDGLGTVVLGRGEEVHLPLFGFSSAIQGLGADLSAWDGRAVRHSGGFVLEPGAGSLAARLQDPASHDVLTVGGVRVTPADGLTVHLSGPRRGPGGAEPLVESVPPGMTAISLEEYYELRQAGHTDDELAANGIWVPSSVRQEYEQRASRQGGDESDR
jgi:hypothetical protein